MNKVFKVIWSEARNAYVVVSEMAKSHGTKSCSTKKLLAMLIATGVMTCASVVPVIAANPAPTDTKIEVGSGASVKGSEGVAIGKNSEASEAGWATAIGGDAKATGAYSVALGNSAKAKELQTIAIGNDSESSGGSSVAVGTRAKASGGASIAISQDANASGEASMAFGISSIASGGHTIAIGSLANALATNAVAIGSQTIADKDNSVAIGPKIQHIGTAAAAVGAQANATGNYSVAMGNLVNVDADWNKNHPGEWRNSGDFSVALGSQSGAWGAVSTAVGALSKAEGDFANAIGSYANASGNYTNAMGLYSAASADYTNAMGIYSAASADYANAIGSYAKADVAYSVALGSASVADRESGVIGAFAPEGADSLTWRANGGAVSVGSATLTRQITNVAAGTEATDAVNVAQLQEATQNTAWHLLAEEEITKDVNSTTKINHGDIVHFRGTDDNITISKEETEDATVMHVALSRNLVIDSVQAGDYFMDSYRGIGVGRDAYITEDGLNANDKVITNVAAGIYNTDAVNVGQLKEVEEVAANANKGWNLSTNGVATEATNVAPGEIVDFSGDKNISVSNDKTKVKVELNKDLVDIESISNGDAKLTLGGLSSKLTNGQGASVKLFGDATIINGKVNVYNDGRIAGVAAGINDTDAVNVSQLKNSAWKLAANGVLTEAEDVKAGDYVDFNGDQNVSVSKDAKDGVKTVKVELNKDLVGIESISNGDAKMALNGAAGTAGMINGKGESIYMQDGYTVINSKVAFDQNGKIPGVAAGEADTDAVNVGQLKNSAWKLAANGVLTEAEDVKAGDYVDFNGDQNISVSKDAKDGVNTVKVELNKDLVGIESISNGDAKMALNGAAGTAGMINGKGASIYMQDGYTVINSKVAFDQNGKISGVAAGAITADSTDAVNGSHLHAVATEAGKHSKVVNGSNINVEEFDNDGQKIYKVNLNKDIMLGDLTGKYVNISGTNGTIEATGAIATKDRVYADKGGKLADIDVTGDKISNGASSIVMDGSNVKVNDKVTIDQNGKISGVAAGEVSKTSTDAINGSQLNQTNENVAALDKRVTQNEADIAQNKADIAQNKADIATNKADIATNKADIATNKANIAQNAADIKKVEELAKKHTTVAAGDNITVTEDTNKDGGKEYKVALDKDIKLDSVTTGQTVMNNDGLKVGDKVSVTATAVTAGKTSISDEGVKVGDKTYISADGLNANDQKITNVKAGDISETSKDAVNGSQLYKTNQEVVNNTNRINKLGSRVNKVGAGAAALAALHPMDFDPDDKLTFSAGYGNYAGENAAAIGAYYRPDEKVMFSVAGTVGNGENMVNAGVSFALDRTNHVSNSRTALAREVIDLRGQLAVMGAKMAKMEKAFGMLDETKTKLFPDVPANHWAYEYIAKLAGNGYIEGYPDGNFGGDRLMTRYEFAAMLYRAIENGAALEEKIIKEFEPELGRIRVDRISGEDGDRDKIERVRVNDTKGERDHYGNKLAK